jgi:hypothetical protein
LSRIARCSSSTIGDPELCRHHELAHATAQEAGWRHFLALQARGLGNYCIGSHKFLTAMSLPFVVL